jgi:hypothetical protein
LAVKKTYDAFDARGWKSQKSGERMVTIYVQGHHGNVQHDLSIAEVVELQELLQKAVTQSAGDSKGDSAAWYLDMEPF